MEHIQRNETPKSFFNPLSRDVNVAYRGDDNKETIYTLPSLTMSTYPTFQADVFIKHIVDAIVNERESGYVTPEERLKIQKEVEL